MRPRLALILPAPYRGGTLRAAKDVAHMLRDTDEGAGLDVVFARPSDPAEPDVDLDDLRDAGIAVREIEWRHVDRHEAERLEATSLEPMVRPLAHDHYCYPCDGAANLLDCQFWLFFSDRVPAPLLPFRRYAALLFDCLQRYVPEIMTPEAWDGQRRALIPFVREAELVLTTTPVTAADVQSFIGVPRARIRTIPMFFALPSMPSSGAASPAPHAETSAYIVWVTNRSRHKNHLRTLKGLELYYDRYAGRLRTVVVGVETRYFRARTPHSVPVVEEYVGRVRRTIAESPLLRRQLTIEGEVSDTAYAERLAGARALLHSCVYDNGTFSVIDATALGVPSISARYPAMEHMDRELGLNLAWFDPFEPDDLARGLAALEQTPPRPASRTHIAEVQQRQRARSAADIQQAIAPWLTARA